MENSKPNFDNNISSGQWRIERGTRVHLHPLYRVRGNNKSLSKSIATSNSLNSVVPCLNNVLNDKKPFWYRSFWAFILTFSTVFCIYQVGDRILYYFEGNTKFNQLVSINDTIRYPSVTVCGSNYYVSPELADEYRKDQNLASKSCINWYQLVGYKEMNVYDVWESNKIANYINLTFFPLAKKIYPDEWLIKKKTVPTFLGFCETIDLSGNLIQYEHGFYTFFHIATIDNSNCSYKYLKVRVHPSSESVRHTINRANNDVTPGIFTDIVISYTKVNFLNRKKDPCVDEATFVNCKDKCMDDILNKRLTCRLPFTNVDLPYCKDPKSALENYNIAEKVYLMKVNCSHCVKKCVEEKYIVALSPWDTGQTSIKLGIYYKDNIFSTATEVWAIDFGTCVAEVGGSLGLFLGFCIINLLDLLDHLVSTMLSKLFKNKNKVSRISH